MFWRSQPSLVTQIEMVGSARPLTHLTVQLA